MVLGRLIVSVHGEQFALIAPRKTTKIFVWCDFITLNIQGNGAGLAANDDLATVGQAIVVAGLFLQLIVLVLYVLAVGVFHIRFEKHTSNKEHQGADRGGHDCSAGISWRQGLKMLYVTNALIIFRSIFRVVEYLMGMDGYLLSNEWPLVVFDAVPMLTLQAVFLFWYPNHFRYLQVEEAGEGQELVNRGNSLPK
jgi:hypothetical protein